MPTLALMDDGYYKETKTIDVVVCPWCGDSRLNVFETKNTYAQSYWQCRCERCQLVGPRGDTPSHAAIQWAKLTTTEE